MTENPVETPEQKQAREAQEKLAKRMRGAIKHPISISDAKAQGLDNDLEWPEDALINNKILADALDYPEDDPIYQSAQCLAIVFEKPSGVTPAIASLKGGISTTVLAERAVARVFGEDLDKFDKDLHISEIVGLLETLKAEEDRNPARKAAEIAQSESLKLRARDEHQGIMRNEDAANRINRFKLGHPNFPECLLPSASVVIAIYRDASKRQLKLAPPNAYKDNRNYHARPDVKSWAQFPSFDEIDHVLKTVDSALQISLGLDQGFFDKLSKKISNLKGDNFAFQLMDASTAGRLVQQVLERAFELMRATGESSFIKCFDAAHADDRSYNVSVLKTTQLEKEIQELATRMSLRRQASTPATTTMSPDPTLKFRYADDMFTFDHANAGNKRGLGEEDDDAVAKRMRLSGYESAENSSTSLADVTNLGR